MGGSCAERLTDLSKAFDYIVHDFLTAKLEHTISLMKPLKLCTVTSQTENTELKSITLINNFIDFPIGIP